MTEDLLSEAYNSGLEHEKAGRLDEAEEAYRRALQLNPEDPGGVTVCLISTLKCSMAFWWISLAMPSR